MKHTVPWTAVALERVGQRVRAHEFQCGVHSVREDLPHFCRNVAVINQGMGDTEFAQQFHPLRITRGRQHGEALFLRQYRGRDPDRRRATTDQNGLPRLDVQSCVKGSVGRLQHLRQCSERGPVKRGLHRYDGTGRNHCVLGIAAVELPAHTAHHRDHLLPGRELLTRCEIHRAGRLDPRDDREAGVRGKPGPEVVLGPVQPERLHLDPNPTRLRLGHRHPRNLQRLRRPRLLQHNRTHLSHSAILRHPQNLRR